MRAHTRNGGCSCTRPHQERIVILCTKQYSTPWHLHLLSRHRTVLNSAINLSSALSMTTIMCEYDWSKWRRPIRSMIWRHTPVLGVGSPKVWFRSLVVIWGTQWICVDQLRHLRPSAKLQDLKGQLKQPWQTWYRRGLYDSLLHHIAYVYRPHPTDMGPAACPYCQLCWSNVWSNNS